MQNMSHGNMFYGNKFYLPEHDLSHKASYCSENPIIDTTRAQGNSLKGGVRKSSRQMTIEGNHVKERRAMERSLFKVKKEWMKVKEEMGYAKERGDYLSESLMEADKKIGEMLEELDRTDEYVRDLVALSNGNF